jgi:hypothetical protein
LLRLPPPNATTDEIHHERNTRASRIGDEIASREWIEYKER